MAFFVGAHLQWDFGKFTTNGPDRCDYNLIIGNTITPNANECVDIKEGSSFNIIEDTDCSKQYDPDSGCFSVRGSNNIVRYLGWRYFGEDSVIITDESQRPS